MGLFGLFRGRPKGEEPRAAAPASVTVVPRAHAAGRIDALPGYLPAGELVFSEGGGTPIAWFTRGRDLRALWARLVADFPVTGLWPVVGLDLDSDPARPWRESEFGGPSDDIPDVESVLRKALWDDEDGGERWRSEFAGLASGGHDGGAVTLTTPRRLAGLALVPARRPADVMAHLGWWGACNHDLSGPDITAVLRSWEDRFGAILTHVGFDALVASVATPPTDAAQAELAAREWYLFCPDTLDQGVETLEALTKLATEKEWGFWWD